MILDWIFGKIGYIRKGEVLQIETERNKWFRAYKREEMAYECANEHIENLKKEIDGFETMESELREQVSIYKQKYADEVQKRLELIEILAESEIVITEKKGVKMDEMETDCHAFCEDSQ